MSIQDKVILTKKYHHSYIPDWKIAKTVSDNKKDKDYRVGILKGNIFT